MSFVVPLSMLEATSEKVEAFVRTKSSGGLTVSRRVAVDSSTLARNVGMSLQSEEHARILRQRFEEDVRAAFRFYTPTAAAFDFAATTVMEAPNLGLRGPDALHPAAAKNQNLQLYTPDKTLLRAADTLGVPASDAGIGAL